MKKSPIFNILIALATSSTAVSRFNNHAMQVHLRTLDLGSDMKVFLNFTQIIGRGTVHTKLAKADADFTRLFVYCKPNLGNNDIPIFQTVVPQANQKVGGADPVIVI